MSGIPVDRGRGFWTRPETLVVWMTVLSVLMVVIILELSWANFAWMKDAFVVSSYFFILLSVLLWGVSLWQWIGSGAFDRTAFFKTHGRGILACFVIASCVVVSVPKHFRLLGGESFIVAVSQSMLFEKRVDSIGAGEWNDRVSWQVRRALDKRPLLFPFFIQIVHLLTGYRVENVFVVNYFVFGGLLLALYFLLRRYLGSLWVFSAIFLFLAHPVVPLSATSGGNDLFSLFFLLISFLFLRSFIDKPSVPGFQVLLFSLLLLSNSRYESVIFLLMILGILLFRGYIGIDLIKRSWSIALIPFLFLPFLWQRLIMLVIRDASFPKGNWADAFHAGNIIPNAAVFLKYSLNWKGVFGLAGLVDFLGLAALSYLACRHIIRMAGAKEKGFGVFGDICFFSVLISLVVNFAYKFGINYQSMSGRLYLLILLVFSVAPVLVLSSLVKDKGVWPKWCLLGAIGIFFCYYPVALADRLGRVPIVQEHLVLEELFRENAACDRLIIYDKPQRAVIYGANAISFGQANREYKTILEKMKNHSFVKIYVIQQIPQKTGIPIPSANLNSVYLVRLVREMPVYGGMSLRISEVTGISTQKRN